MACVQGRVMRHGKPQVEMCVINRKPVREGPVVLGWRRGL